MNKIKKWKKKQIEFSLCFFFIFLVSLTSIHPAKENQNTSLQTANTPSTSKQANMIQTLKLPKQFQSFSTQIQAKKKEKKFHGNVKTEIGIKNMNEETFQEYVENIKKSMQKNFLISTIIVNENFEVIDGQHRLIASKDLGLPIYYFINNNMILCLKIIFYGIQLSYDSNIFIKVFLI